MKSLCSLTVFRGWPMTICLQVVNLFMNFQTALWIPKGLPPHRVEAFSEKYTLSHLNEKI